MRMKEIETTGAAWAATNAEDRSANCNLSAGAPTALIRKAPSSWPFNPGDVTPLEWWRTIPADQLGDAQVLHLRFTMAKIGVMKDRQWLLALRGDAAASIAIAIETIPIDRVTLEVDLAMSALALCALDGSAGAALVLAHILGRTTIDHPFGKELSASWLVHNLCRALTAKRAPAKPHLHSKNSNTPNERKTSPCRQVPA